MLHGIGVWREFCGRVACKRQRIDDSIFDLLNSSETHGHIALGGTLTSIDSINHMAIVIQETDHMRQLIILK